MTIMRYFGDTAGPGNIRLGPKVEKTAPRGGDFVGEITAARLAIAVRDVDLKVTIGGKEYSLPTSMGTIGSFLASDVVPPKGWVWLDDVDEARKTNPELDAFMKAFDRAMVAVDDNLEEIRRKRAERRADAESDAMIAIAKSADQAQRPIMDSEAVAAAGKAVGQAIGFVASEMGRAVGRAVSGIPDVARCRCLTPPEYVPQDAFDVADRQEMGLLAPAGEAIVKPSRWSGIPDVDRAVSALTIPCPMCLGKGILPALPSDPCALCDGKKRIAFEKAESWVLYTVLKSPMPEIVQPLNGAVRCQGVFLFAHRPDDAPGDVDVYVREFDVIRGRIRNIVFRLRDTAFVRFSRHGQFVDVPVRVAIHDSPTNIGQRVFGVISSPSAVGPAWPAGDIAPTVELPWHGRADRVARGTGHILVSMDNGETVVVPDGWKVRRRGGGMLKVADMRGTPIVAFLPCVEPCSKCGKRLPVAWRNAGGDPFCKAHASSG